MLLSTYFINWQDWILIDQTLVCGACWVHSRHSQDEKESCHQIGLEPDLERSKAVNFSSVCESLQKTAEQNTLWRTRVWVAGANEGFLQRKEVSLTEPKVSKL